MKRSLFCAGLVSASLSLFACGGSGSPSDTDDILSSAGDKPESSSSVVEDESSSSVSKDIPKGARAATLDDLERNMTLKGLFGKDVLFVSGAKHGLFSLWIPDTAWVITPSAFEDGVLDFGSAAIAAIDVKDDAVKSMKELAEKDSKHTIRFIVNEEGNLQYSYDKGKYKDVGEASVKTSSSIISNGDSLAANILDCKDGDDVKVTYSFYDGRYIAEEENGDTLSWTAGYYDIHRGKLLMRPLFFPQPTYSMFTATVSKDFGIEFSTGRALTCKTKKLDYKNVAVKDMAQEWDVIVDGLEWMLDLKDDMSFVLEAYKGLEGKELKKGTWDVYGDNLMLKVTGCLNKGCTTAVRGEISKLDTKKGFTYNHTDEDEPNIPKEWEVPQYE